MTELRSMLKLPEGLASFNNVELYYIISKLFGLGGFGEHFIEKERLYLCFEQEYQLSFLFISTLPIISETQNEPQTSIYYGHFDEEFEDIKIVGGIVPFELFSGDRSDIGDGSKISELLCKSARHFVKPVELVEGLLGIVTAPDFGTREPNNTFLLSKDSKMPDWSKVDLALFANNQVDNVTCDFSGSYFLVAEPIESFESNTDNRGTIVHEYLVGDDPDDNVIVKSHPVSDQEMKRIENIDVRLFTVN